MSGRWWSAMRARLGAIEQRGQFEREMAEEIAFHIAKRAEQLEAEGFSAVEARRRARLEFGTMEGHKSGMRAAFGLRTFDDLWMDLRFAGRMLRSNAGFTAMAVLSLGLAIGANTSMFSLANEVLYRRLGIAHTEQLRLLTLQGREPLIDRSSWGDNWIEDGVEKIDVFSYPMYQLLRKENRTLAALVAFKDLGRVNLTAGGQAQAGSAQLVSGDFYSALDVRTQLGRPILPSDDGAPGTGSVAVISNELWRRVFDGSPAVLGRTLNVNGTTVTIVGVNVQGFTGAQSAQSSPDVFLPLSLLPQVHQAFGGQNPLTSATLWWVNLVGRSRPGVADATVAANLNAVFSAAVNGTMVVKAGEHIPTVVVQDGSRGLNFGARILTRPIHVLLGLTGLVLLLACANIANLMLARASAREREIAVRLALGAGRARVFRQILTESLLLATVGGVVGLGLSFVGRQALPSLIQNSWDMRQLQVAFDWRVFAFSAAVTMGTGVLFGVLPAWRSSRGEAGLSLREAGKSGSRRRRAWTGKCIVAFQVALSTLLVAASALFLRTLLNLDHVQPGFRTHGLLEVDVAPAAKRYPGRRSIDLLEEMEARFRTVPGVRGVSFAQPALLDQASWDNDFDVEGAAKQTSDANKTFPYLSTVGQDFFSVMQIRMLRGRAFGSQDTATSTKVAVINQTIAREYFRGVDPIGRRFSISGGEDGTRKVTYTVIGVCADTLYSQVRDPVQPLHFELYRQGDSMLGGTLLLDTDVPAKELMPTLRRVVQQMDPDLPLTNVRTLDEQIDVDLRQERTFASLSCGFGVLALLLACVGVYGIMAYTVTQRTNEIGIRLALGAQRGQVRGMILREASLLAFAGVALGLAAILGLVRLVQSQLYGLKPRDPASLAGTALTLLGLAVVAAWVPAARAARLDPMQALRHD